MPSSMQVLELESYVMFGFMLIGRRPSIRSRFYNTWFHIISCCLCRLREVFPKLNWINEDKLTRKVWISLCRGMGLYRCLELVCLDGSFRMLMLCMYMILNAKDDIMMTLHKNDTTWWLILLWTYNWSMLLKVWCRTFKKVMLCEVEY